MEATSSVTSAVFQQTTRRYSPEDRTIHNPRSQNFKSYIWLKYFYPSVYSYSSLLSWIWHRVVRKKLTNVLQERTASIFRLEEKAKKQTSSSHTLGHETEIVHFSNMLLNIYQTTRRKIPKNGTLHSQRRENLKSDEDILLNQRKLHFRYQEVENLWM
jgi:hypothetical protein